MIFNVFFVQMILNFQKEINEIIYIFLFYFIFKFESFHLNNFLIKYDFSKFVFL
jgi:hypothetical protein